jgi:hypothetical protein
MKSPKPDTDNRFMLLKYFPPKNKQRNESTDVGQPAHKHNEKPV